MKRYSALKLIFPSGVSMLYQVVEVDEAGKALCSYPLRMEQHSTEWLSGALLLSPIKLYTADLEDWDKLLKKINASTHKQVEAFFLYHIPMFNMQSMKPFGGRKLIQLL